MSVIAYVKEHPYTIAGVVAGGLVLYLLYSAASGGGGTTVVGPSGPSDAQVQANTALQLGQLQIAGHSADLQEQLAAAQIAANVSYANKQLDTQLGLFQTQAGADVSMAGIDAQRQVQIAGLSTQQIIAGYAQTTAQDQINAGVDIAKITAQTYSDIAQFNAATTIASYKSATDIAVSHDQTQVAINSATQKTEQKKSSNGLIGSVIGGIASVLSFF